MFPPVHGQLTVETLAQRGLAASSLNHCGHTGLHPSHRRHLTASFYVAGHTRLLSLRSRMLHQGPLGDFPMLAWLLHRRCQARCCLRPRGVGWHSSCAHLPFCLRLLSGDRHIPKIQNSRGYGSDSGHTPFTSLDSHVDPMCGSTRYRAVDWALLGRAYAFASPLNVEPEPGSNDNYA